MTTAPANSPTTTASTDRVPPQDLDAEMALLGSMMMSRDAIGEVIPIIGREDSGWFYLPAHQKLFEVLIDQYDDPAKAIDLIAVSDELRRRELFDLVGGHEYMVQLAESFADWANAEYYARIVRDKGMLRELIRCTGEIADRAYSGFDEARDILDVAEQKIFNVTERRVGGQVVGIREAVTRLAKQLELKGEGVCTGLPTGFIQLDELTAGFQPGDLIIVAGRPSMGKTALALCMARHAALHDQRPVAFFSMEMSIDQIAQRLVCAHTGVNSKNLRRRTLSEEDLNRLLHACAEFESTPLLMDDTPGMTVMEVRSKARRLKQKHDIEAVFVDYLQLMHSPKAESRQVEIATISRGLKSLARELHIPVVALAQLNRMPEGRHDKRPLMSDLRESGAIEQDADVVMLIHREEYYNPDVEEKKKNQAELIIAKQRNGPTGSLALHFDRTISRFANRSVEAEPFGPTETYEPAASAVPF
jgi:replicative DNA helicase